MLGHVIGLGTSEALEVALHVMEDPNTDFPHKASLFFELLQGVDDPRISSAAASALEANLALGKDSWVHTKGYLNLVAVCGGRLGAQELLGRALNSEGQLRMVAIDGIAMLKDHSLVSDFLELAASGPPYDQVLLSLADWDDPVALSEIRRFACDEGLDTLVRARAFEAWGRGMPSVDLGGMIQELRSTPPEDYSIALRAVGGALSIQRNEKREDIAAIVAPALIEGLLHQDQEVVNYSFSIVRDYAKEMPESVRETLQAILGTSNPFLSRDEVRKALEAMGVVGPF